MNQMNSMRPTACDQYSRRSLAEAHGTAGTTPLFSSHFTLSIMKFSRDHANSRSPQNSRSAPHPLERVDNELTRLTFCKVYHVWAIAPNPIP